MSRADSLEQRSRNKPTPPFSYAIADGSDDEDIRRLLREAQMEGDLQVTLEREPHSAQAAAIEGPEHQRILARDVRGQVVAMGSRSVRERWVGEDLERVGYYGELRVDSRYRARPSLVRGGFRRMRELHEEDGQTQIYFASVVGDNHPALRLLSAGLPGFPACRTLGELVTLVFKARGRRLARSTPGLEVRRAESGDLDSILELLQNQARSQDLSPRWTRDDLLSAERTRGLAISDFFIASRSGRDVACLALWDQRAFKQVVIRAYGGKLAQWRRPMNVALGLSGRPTLPAPTTTLEQAFASHLAVEQEDVDAVRALLSAVRLEATTRGIDHIVTSFAEGSAELAAISGRLPAWRYRSTLLEMAWDESVFAGSRWRSDSLNPEVAVL